MPGQDETGDVGLAELQKCLERQRHRLVHAEHAEVREAARLRFEQRCGDGRRRGLEADAGEDHLPPGLGGRDLHRVARRVDDAHVGAGGARGRQGRARRRHADEVAEGRQRHLRQTGEGHSLVQVGGRRDAHRAPWPGDQPHPGREQVAQTEAGDRNRVGAAHFHVGEVGQAAPLESGMRLDRETVGEAPQGVGRDGG